MPGWQIEEARAFDLEKKHLLPSRSSRPMLFTYMARKWSCHKWLCACPWKLSTKALKLRSLAQCPRGLQLRVMMNLQPISYPPPMLHPKALSKVLTVAKEYLELLTISQCNDKMKRIELTAHHFAPCQWLPAQSHGDRKPGTPQFCYTCLASFHSCHSSCSATSPHRGKTPHPCLATWTLSKQKTKMSRMCYDLWTIRKNNCLYLRSVLSKLIC